MAREGSSMRAGSSVEQERLLVLVDTQKKHINELKKQLQDTLEVQKQQQLQLVQQSPARKSTRKLLERAAADNTVLANRVEELRSQRNALFVTKAALTAQVSELIKVAADDRQREAQHKLVLHQLAQLCRLIQQPHLQRPEEQMAAVVAHIKQLYREKQELSEKLDTALRSSSSSYKDSSCTKVHHNQPPAQAAPAAAAGARLHRPCSPTALKLDQAATSKLIWADSCTDLFAALQQQQQQQAPGAAHGSTDASGSSQVLQQQPPGAAGGAATPGSCCDSFITAQSHLLDMSYISPLRGRASCSLSPLKHSQMGDTTPSSGTAAAETSGACVSARAAAGAVTALGGAGTGTPLSAQSLSAFSCGGAAQVTPSPRLHRALQLLLPSRRAGRCLKAHSTTPKAATAETAAAQKCSPQQDSNGAHNSNNSRTSSSGSLSEVLSDLLTPVGGAPEQRQQQQDSSTLAWSAEHTPAAATSATASTACSRLTPKATSAAGGSGFGSSFSFDSSSKPGAVGLSLQPEFRLAAADSLWPSPAAVAARSSCGFRGAAAAAVGSGLSSHALWLPAFDDASEDDNADNENDEDNEEDEEEGDCSQGSQPGSPVGLCPRALTDRDFLQARTDDELCCADDAHVILGGGFGCEDSHPQSADTAQHMRQAAVRPAGLWAVLRTGVWLAGAAAAGAAGCKYRHSSAVQRLVQLQQGAAAAAVQTQQHVSGKWQQACRQLQRGVRRARQAVPAATVAAPV